MSCIKIIESEKHSNKSKHIDIKYHAHKNLKENGTIKLCYCPSKLMIADILTKPEPKPNFQENRKKLKLQDKFH